MASAPSSPESCDLKGGDKAGRNYWDELWKNQPLPPSMDPSERSLDNYFYRKFHELFQDLFQDSPMRGRKLLEIGCAQSVYLPYFAKYLGFEVYGLDRSEIGCARARTILEREGVTGEVYCADLFCPPQYLLESFDVVASLGVVEHFENTAEPLRAMARLLKPEGRMVTEVPNLAGILGILQKILDRSIYDIHVRLDREKLGAAHREAGLEVERCEYWLPINLEVLNVERWSKGLRYETARRAQRWISKAVWLIDDHLPVLRPNPWTSPYLICAARKARPQPVGTQN